MFEQAFRNIDDALRKEAGCTTELDYTEQTSWLLFLKYLDGLEQDRADIALMHGKKYAYNASIALRKELLAACDLHTILDCPGGTFLGAGVKTVVLFFDKGAPTRKVWYYQLEPGRNMGKTNPLNDEDLAEFLSLQPKKKDSAKSWTVDVKTLDPATFDLSVKNPTGGEEVTHRTPQEIMDEIAALDAESAQVLATIRELL